MNHKKEFYGKEIFIPLAKIYSVYTKITFLFH